MSSSLACGDDPSMSSSLSSYVSGMSSLASPPSLHAPSFKPAVSEEVASQASKNAREFESRAATHRLSERASLHGSPRWAH